MEWRSAGLGWPDGNPVLRWDRGRVSPLAYGKEIGFRVVGERYCVGARGNACPLGAVVAGRASQARCAECARLDRAFSVAADGVPDDPRTYRVYLAWFGAGMAKVGITAEERGSVRLLEQGAVAFSWLGRGPLMAARRTEELLRAALGVPDRIPYAKKRAVRHDLPGWPERVAEIRELHRRAVALEGWPESLERVAFEAVDHAGAFGLAGLAPLTRVVSELAAGGVVAGRLVAAAGPDLHLVEAATGAGAESGVLVLDTRLMSGWALTKGDGGTTVPVREVEAASGDGGVQEGLF
ncbi:DUF2797 domain-containing protein [Streptomyces sp. 21So2-11]|uniref:DUF2797 domain-containing protein n=1 Tax=Streptomyces sp. 21So2-11 TaxID=3144408 RepID=UPI00321BD9E3